MRQQTLSSSHMVRGVVARSPRPTKAAALLLATVLAVPAFFVLTLVDRWM